MKNPREMRARAERYRKHARAITDTTVQEVIRSVADNLDHEADRIDHDAEGEPDKPREPRGH